MEVRAAIRARRMVRAFTGDAVPPELVDDLIELACRAPSAGNTRPWHYVVLEGAATRRLWDVTLPAERRTSFRWQGLLRAPVLVVPVVDPQAYVERYAEGDKRADALGSGLDAWPVPYWWIDGGMAVHGLLLAAVDAGLGALFFGLFEHEPAVLSALEVPGGMRALGVVALGWPALDEPGRSAARPRPPLRDILHRGGWSATQT